MKARMVVDLTLPSELVASIFATAADNRRSLAPRITFALNVDVADIGICKFAYGCYAWRRTSPVDTSFDWAV
jgi:hypothetical protein